MRSFRVFAFAATLIFAVAIGRAQAASQEWTDCGGANPDLQISACTKIIQSGQETGLHLAWAYNNRGNGYTNTGKYDRAIEDFNQALRLARFPAALNGRCFARACANRELEAALADCNEALSALPQSAAAPFLDSRGFVYFRLGQFDKAIADYTAVLSIEPKKAPSLYMRGIAKRRMGDVAGGDADIAAARAIVPKIGDAYATHGVTP